MKYESISESIACEDFIIQIVPKLDEKSHWTGQVEVNIIFSENSCLDEREFESLLFFTQMVCASVPIYEDHDSIREMAAWLVDKKFSNGRKNKLNGGDRVEIIGEKSNVIKVDFNPKKEN